MDKLYTAQVAKKLGLTKRELSALLVRAPALRPAERSGTLNRLLWSDAEIEAVQHYMMTRRRGSRLHTQAVQQAGASIKEN